MMNTLILIGSRNENGQTAQAAQALVAGLEGAGGRATLVYLPKGNVQRCRQCEDSGWGFCLAQGKCEIEDDLPQLIEQLRQADAVVLATPVYFGDLSESMRAFLDRLRRVTWQGPAKEFIRAKPAIGLCVAGGGGGGALHCAANMENILAVCGFDVLDMIPVRRQNLEFKREVLRLTGQWLACSVAAGQTA